MPTYELLKLTPTSDEMVKRTDDDGRIWWIPKDPRNADYQMYLASLEDEGA